MRNAQRFALFLWRLSGPLSEAHIVCCCGVMLTLSPVLPHRGRGSMAVL